MKRTSAAVVFVLTAGIAIAADDAEKQQIQVSKTDRVDFAPGGTIRIGGLQDKAHGDVNVTGWDRPEVEITVNKSTQGLYSAKEADEARKRLELITITHESKTPTELTISTTFPKRTLKRLFRGKSDVMLEYQVHVPRNSHLVVHEDMGALLVTDVTGDIEATVGTGDIVLMLPGSEGYSVDARTKFGGVESDFGGVAVQHHIITHHLAFAPAASKHKVFLRVGTGGISIKAMPATTTGYAELGK